MSSNVGAKLDAPFLANVVQSEDANRTETHNTSRKSFKMHRMVPNGSNFKVRNKFKQLIDLIKKHCRSHIKELSRLPLDDPPSTRLPRATMTRLKKYTQTKPQQPISSSDSSRNSSPGINQTQGRLYTANTGGSPSLRRSLLLAARTPQVPPSPTTHRRSTLTQPTQSSAAKSAPSRNLKQNVAKPPVKTVSQTTSRPTSAKRNATVAPIQKNVVNKRTTPPVVRKTDCRSASPRLAAKPKEIPKKTDSPKPQTKKVDSPKKSPVKKPMQRSDTFLKEGPTVLQKI